MGSSAGVCFSTRSSTSNWSARCSGGRAEPSWLRSRDQEVVERSRAARFCPIRRCLSWEVTSESNADTDRVVKRKWYAECGARPYLLVDRQERFVTLYSEPGQLGSRSRARGGTEVTDYHDVLAAGAWRGAETSRP
ncbi:Uma2 family endonuclease [Streptomyces sp. NPDC048483]|uniref:Uma2 family endonuclease n=1 Tax=Streptomyces sp. NPDC048483 TaxID=3154927 RepID=UPI00344AFE93